MITFEQQGMIAKGAVEDAKQLLEMVLRGDVLLAVIPGFTDPVACEHMTQKMMTSSTFSMYAEAPVAKAGGTPFFDTAHKEQNIRRQRVRRYLDEADGSMADVVAACRPYTPPMQELLRLLNQRWPGGADRLRTAKGEGAFAGLWRMFLGDEEHGSGTLIHTDMAFDIDGAEAVFPIRVAEQVACNVYTAVSDQGGELAIWPHKIDATRDIEWRIPGSYGLRPECVGQPVLVYKPGEGDATLFGCYHPHQVMEAKGKRVSNSMFIGPLQQEEGWGPLSAWS